MRLTIIIQFGGEKKVPALSPEQCGQMLTAVQELYRICDP
jgi:hypothetical protein